MGIDAITIASLALAVIVALYIARTVVSKIGGGRKKSNTGLETHMHRECAVCGWSGTASKYVKKCSNCGADLYE